MKQGLLGIKVKWDGGILDTTRLKKYDTRILSTNLVDLKHYIPEPTGILFPQPRECDLGQLQDKTNLYPFHRCVIPFHRCVISGACE